MNTKRKPSTPPIPTDPLSPVVEKLKALTPREIDALAVACGASAMTVKNIRDGKVGPLGPSLYLVMRLYDTLVRNVAPTPAQ